jgi:hypothetical protein
MISIHDNEKRCSHNAASLPVLLSDSVLPLTRRHFPLQNHRRTERRHSDHNSFMIRSNEPSATKTKERQSEHHKCHGIVYQILFVTLFAMNVSFLVLYRAELWSVSQSIGYSRTNFIQREISVMVHPYPQTVTQKPVILNGNVDDDENAKPQPSGDRITYFSQGRHDRSGAVVHDMLWVHAYAFSQNGVYGGACGGPDTTKHGSVASKTKIMTYQNVTQELLNELQWNRALKYACPSNYSNSTTEIMVDRDFYTKLDASFFTRQWKESFREQIAIDDQSSTGKSSNTTVTINTEDNVYTIAVHIRRGDVDPCTFANRYLSNDYYLRLITKYYKEVPIRYQTVVVNIYSESSSYESFDIFQNVYKYNVHLDDTLYNVWHALSTANVAILSKSSFSYVPAIINPNIVVYTSYRHFPLPSWEVVNQTISDAEKRNVNYIHDHECATQRIL